MDCEMNNETHECVNEEGHIMRKANLDGEKFLKGKNVIGDTKVHRRNR